MLYQVHSLVSIADPCRDGVVSFGNFDGVHLGHKQLVDSLARLARSRRVSAIAFTFDPHPVTLLRPDQSLVPLTWPERKAELLHECGVDHVVMLHTTIELLRMTGEQFFDQAVRQGLRAQGLVEGPNFGFGRNRSGSIATLHRLCTQWGIELEVVDPLVIDEQVVSSSRIRQCLAAGQVEVAHRLLGRPHRIRGRVGPGAGRGAALGFPTANLSGCDNLVPADGVYAGIVRWEGCSFAVALHIGPNLTFSEDSRKIEAHLLGFSGDLAGQTMEIDLLARIRGTQKFANASELVDQMRQDVEQVRISVDPECRNPATP